MDFDTYNNNVTIVLKNAISKHFKEEAIEKLNKKVESIFSGSIPKEITISKLIEMFKEDAFSDREDESGDIIVDCDDFFQSNYECIIFILMRMMVKVNIIATIQ